MCLSNSVTNVRRERVRLPLGCRVEFTRDCLEVPGTVRAYGSSFNVWVKWDDGELTVHDSRDLERVGG